MQIGIVGYQGSGKSTLFHWLTGVEPDPALAHRGQAAMCPIPEPRVEQLEAIYQPKKRTLAALEIVDTPGRSRTHEGSAGKLAAIRESACLVIVVRAYGGHDPRHDLGSFRDDLLIADLDIVTRRLERLAEQIKKPRPNRDELLAEEATLHKVHKMLEEGADWTNETIPLEEEKRIRSFQLFALKPQLIVVNIDDDEENPESYRELFPSGVAGHVIPLRLQCELEAMDREEREAFCEELGLAPADKQQLVRDVMHVSGQILFFTAGEKEVRTWLLRKGGTAVEAAGNIHTDLARGFIRAEVMRSEDLIRLGSERAVKAENLSRQEPKDYEIQEGDVVLIRHN